MLKNSLARPIAPLLRSLAYLHCTECQRKTKHRPMLKGRTSWKDRDRGFTDIDFKCQECGVRE